MNAKNNEAELILSVVRGETEIDELSELGVVIKDDGAVHRIESPGRLPVVEPTLEDFASGLYSNWARSTAQRAWAQLIMGGLFIDVSALEDQPGGERLLELISDVSTGSDLQESDVALISEILDPGRGKD